MEVSGVSPMVRPITESRLSDTSKNIFTGKVLAHLSLRGLPVPIGAGIVVICIITFFIFSPPSFCSA